MQLSKIYGTAKLAGNSKISFKPIQDKVIKKPALTKMVSLSAKNQRTDFSRILLDDERLISSNAFHKRDFHPPANNTDEFR